MVVRVAPGYCCGCFLKVFFEILHRNETTCEVVNPRFRNLDCKTNEIGMPRVERGSLATSSCSGSSRQFGICRGTRQADTDYLHLGTPPRLGHSNEHGVAAAVVQLTSSTLCISGRFNASRSTRCFSCVFAPKTELGKNCQFPFFLKSRPRSVW